MLMPVTVTSGFSSPTPSTLCTDQTIGSQKRSSTVYPKLSARFQSLRLVTTQQHLSLNSLVCLANVIAVDLAQTDAQPHTANLATPAGPSPHMRRPLLLSLRQIDSIRDLVPYFSAASISSYESVYGSGGVIDWPAVERGLLEDLFEGR